MLRVALVRQLTRQATAIGRLATVEGTTVVTHTSDCYNCDFRLAHVTVADRTVRKLKNTYPLEISNRSKTWEVANLEFATLDLRGCVRPV